MSKIVFTFSSDGKLFDVGKSSKVMIIENASPYKEELYDIVEENKLSFGEIKILVESWGGKIDLVLLSELIKKYKKNNN